MIEDYSYSDVKISTWFILTAHILYCSALLWAKMRWDYFISKIYIYINYHQSPFNERPSRSYRPRGISSAYRGNNPIRGWVKRKLLITKLDFCEIFVLTSVLFFLVLVRLKAVMIRLKIEPLVFTFPCAKSYSTPVNVTTGGLHFGDDRSVGDVFHNFI